MNNKSKELRTTTDVVMHVLQHEPATRNSDNLLFVRVCAMLNKDAICKPMWLVLPHLQEYGLPSIETVGRCRRKIVETHPELAGSDHIEGQRMLNEETFKEYAKGAV